MMNLTRPMSPEARALSLTLSGGVLLTGVTLLGGCSEEPPPPPPPPPPVKVEKPKSKTAQSLKAELGVDERIHMDEALAHRDESIRAAALLFAHALLTDDRDLARRLSGTDDSVEGMLGNPPFSDARHEVERVDLEFGRIFGGDAMLAIWEFPDRLDAQMWAIAGPVPPAEASFFWPGFSNEFTKAGEADVSSTDSWAYTDGAQVAFFAAPGMPNMIDRIGEEPFRDWSDMVASWHEVAKEPDLKIVVIDWSNLEFGDDGSGSGPRAPSAPGVGPGPGSSPGVRPR